MLRAIGIHSFPSIILCVLENKHSDHKGPTHEQRLHQSTAELITHNARNQYHVIYFYTILIPKNFQFRPPESSKVRYKLNTYNREIFEPLPNFPSPKPQRI